ncbi:MAG: hypothetical protein K1Y36_10125 [Blastocatellia bacterium]|nr:hypothetical protein [Blastocatellia bacterium]
MSQSDLEQVFEVVLASPSLQAELNMVTSLDVFIERLLAISHAHGGSLTMDDITDAIRQRQREWLQRGML